MGFVSREDGRNSIIGFVIGVASMLPGVSGGLIAVLCGVYERVIEDISDLKNKLFSDFRFLLMIGIGLLLGMLVCTIVLDHTMDSFALGCMAFFFGLIIVQVPDVLKLAGYSKVSDLNLLDVVFFIIGLGIIIILLIINMNNAAEVNPDEHTIVNFVLFAICGVALAVSKIMPGISGSTLLIALGLFDVTISSIAHLDMFFLVPLCIGLVVGVLGFAKVMKYCLEHYRGPTYMMILGFTVGSLIMLIYEISVLNPSNLDYVIVVVLAIVGAIVGYAFSYYGKKMNLNC